MDRKLFILGALACTLGLFSIASTNIFGLAYPNPLFHILGLAGLFLILLSLIFFAAGWICSIRKELKAKNRLAAIFLLLGGLLFIAIHALKMIR